MDDSAADSGEALSSQWPMPPVLLVPAFTELPAWWRWQHTVGMLALSGGRAPAPARLRLKDEQGREGGVQTWRAPRGLGLRNWNKAHVAGGEGEDEEGAGPVQDEEVGFCPGSKDGRNDLTHLLGERGPGRRKHCLLSAEVSFLICGKCEDFLFPPGWC